MSSAVKVLVSINTLCVCVKERVNLYFLFSYNLYLIVFLNTVLFCVFLFQAVKQNQCV